MRGQERDDESGAAGVGCADEAVLELVGDGYGVES
jgi:hypothetical protein